MHQKFCIGLHSHEMFLHTKTFYNSQKDQFNKCRTSICFLKKMEARELGKRTVMQHEDLLVTAQHIYSRYNHLNTYNKSNFTNIP